MAVITSNRNDSVGSHTTVNPNAGTTWAGGVAPAAADSVYVVGRRTTINMTGFAKWTGTKTITVASTTYFATVGFFYTITDRSEFIKVNYTGISGNTFTGCTVDETDSFYSWINDGTIYNGAYVQNPAYILEISAGQTFEVAELILQEGGWVYVNGGTLKIGMGITVRDGRLIGRGTGSIIITRNSAAVTVIGYLNTENYVMSIVDIDGGENRTYSNTTSPSAIGDVSVAINAPTNGTFAIGDEVSLYDEGKTGYRLRVIAAYRGDATHSFKNSDEGFDVCGVDGNTIYLAQKGGSKGYVKQVSSNETQKILFTKPEITYFEANDIVVINNVKYTIDSVEDSDVTLYDYDFTNPSTSLTDFWVGDSTHIYSAGWNIESGVGLRTGTDSYRELVNKYFWDREVIVEAEMSPLAAYISGTRGTGTYGILTSYDPAFRWGHSGYSATKTDVLQISDAGDSMHFYVRGMTQYSNNRLSRDIPLRDATRVGATYKIETRRGRTLTTVNGSEFSTDFRRDGNYNGLAGIHMSNQYARCRRLTIKLPVQKIFITTTNTFNVDDVVYKAGMEGTHPTGSKLVKLASLNAGTGNHSDLAYAYLGKAPDGQSVGSGKWPLMIQVNGANSTSSTMPLIHNHDMNDSYYYDLGNAQTAKSLTIDLITQQTFSHVSFRPRVADYAYYYGYNGVAIYGSNDLTNWTTLYGPTNDTKKFYYDVYNQLAYFATGTVSFRYVKFETKGAQVSPYPNRYVNIGVHNFSDGFKIGVNNASDFAIGERISVMIDSSYGMGSKEIQAYYAWVNNSAANPETFYHGGWLPECTITGKSGNILTLDKPIFWGYMDDNDKITVIKTNKNFLITGTMGPTNSSNDWRWPNINLAGGASNGRIHFFKNIRFDYIGSYRYSGSTSHNRGIQARSYDYWIQTIFDGNTHMMSQDSNSWGGLVAYSANSIIRNSFITGTYTGLCIYYPASFCGNAFFNNKIQNIYYGIRTEYARAYSLNNNEVSGCDTGIYVGTNRTDRMAIPMLQEIRRNYIKGSSTAAITVYNHSVPGAFQGPRIKTEYNRVKSSDDYAILSSVSTDLPFSYMSAYSDNTGSRISRFRNEGFISSGDILSDLNYVNWLKNYGRYGYDLIHGVYNIYEKDYTRPNSIRVYTPTPDAYFPLFGIELDVLEDNVPLQIFVQLEYRYPQIARIQDDGTDDGRLRFVPLQHGVITGSIQYGAIPSTLGTGWNTFTGTFPSFSTTATEGKAAVYMARAAANGYIEVRNMTAIVLTDYPNKIKILGNTFNVDAVFDQMRMTRNMKALTAPTRATKITRVKF